MRLERREANRQKVWTLHAPGNGVGTLDAITMTARAGLTELMATSSVHSVYRIGRLRVDGRWGTIESAHAELLERHPIAIEAGFEGNPGVEGGVWRNQLHENDALVHLKFLAGTVSLPLHVHEFSDRFIMGVSGIGLFHYAPSASANQELCSVVVHPGDVIAFSRGLLHTFTAPISDLVLLSYHSPFFALDDARQFTLPESTLSEHVDWRPASLVECKNASSCNELTV